MNAANSSVWLFPPKIDSANGGQASTSGIHIQGMRNRRPAATAATNMIPTATAPTSARGSPVSSAKNGSVKGGYRNGWVAPGGELNALARYGGSPASQRAAARRG